MSTSEHERRRIWAAHWLDSPTLRWAVRKLFERGDPAWRVAEVLGVSVQDARELKRLTEEIAD